LPALEGGGSAVPRNRGNLGNVTRGGIDFVEPVTGAVGTRGPRLKECGANHI
jgi:hypothetical protein